MNKVSLIMGILAIVGWTCLFFSGHELKAHDSVLYVLLLAIWGKD